MHEYPITQRIIEIAQGAARGSRVSQVTLVMGEDCGCLSESVSLYFDLLSEGTSCAGAALVIERVKPQLACKACGRTFLREPFCFSCPDCGGESAPTGIGREFYVKSIEVMSNEK